MHVVPADTSLAAGRRKIRTLRRLDISERARITFELSDNLRSTAEAGLRAPDPAWDQEQAMREVLRPVAGDYLFEQVFGDDRAAR